MSKVSGKSLMGIDEDESSSDEEDEEDEKEEVVVLHETGPETFAAMHADKDGKITLQELTAEMLKEEDLKEEYDAVSKAFAQADEGADGQLGKEEVQKLLDLLNADEKEPEDKAL